LEAPVYLGSLTNFWFFSAANDFDRHELEGWCVVAFINE
jgi:hypothetical protein